MKLLTALAAAVAVAFSSSVDANSLRAAGTQVAKDMTLVSRHLETAAFLAAMSVPPECVQENGYDYVGSDIGNALGAAVDCCDLCIHKDGCHAYSWSNLNGGTCWFKSGRGTVVVNAGVKSGAVVFPSQIEAAPCTSGSLDVDTDYVGFDVGSASAAKPENCCAECSKVAGCHAFTWTSYNSGTCWLKSRRGRMVYKQGASSGINYADTNSLTCAVEAGVDYVGNDIGSTSAAKPEDCCAKCEQKSYCRAFSWTNQDGGMCYFKNLKGDAVAKAGVTSGAIRPNPRAPSCVMELATDFVGNDIGSKPSPDAYGCCSICMLTGNCAAFSWTSQSGGTCWLKSGKGATVANANVQSARVAVQIMS